MAMSQGYGVSARAGGGRLAAGVFRSGLRLLFLLCLLGAVIGLGLRQIGDGLLGAVGQTSPGILFRVQDLPWFTLGIVIIAYVGWAMQRPLPDAVSRWLDRHAPDTARPVRHPLAIAAAVLILGGAGALIIYKAEPFAGERAAAFQASIFGGGLAAAPIAEAWADYVHALMSPLATQDPQTGAWASAGGPVLPAIRAAFDFARVDWILGAGFAALSILLAAAIARRLWPDQDAAPILAAVFLATSPQFLFTGMTGSPWGPLLCLNLLWLWLYMRDDRRGHLAAALVGIVAAGVQHIEVHALFVLPFLLRLLVNRRWPLVCLYAASYGLATLAWLHWTGLVAAATAGIGAEEALNAAIGPVQAGILAYALPSAADIATALLNLLRMLGWMNVIIVPLVFAALRPWSRTSFPFRPLAVGILVAVVVSLFLPAERQDGWGNPYLHGHLGSLALLATLGWVRLATGKPQLRPDLNRAVGLCCAAMLLVAMPLRAVQVERVASTTIAAVRHVQAFDTDVVLVDQSGIWFGPELVRNDPFLQNRPKIMGLQRLTEDQIRALCDRYTIAVVDYHDLTPMGIKQIAPTSQAGYEVSSPDRAVRSIATGPRCTGG